MDYLFENLGPDRFQQLCQTLLTKIYDGVKCYPIGQADGGRDGVGSGSSASEESIVFQVKYRKHPQAEKTPHKWLLDTIAGEAQKIGRLIKTGTTKYVLITNVPGTGALDSGSIDKMEVELGKHIGVPYEIWWRDDLVRRLEAHPECASRYVEILNAQDLLIPLLANKNVNDTENERRLTCIKHYLSDSYETEKTIRFRQVELHNEILDLFVDLPFSMDVLEAPAELHHGQYRITESDLSFNVEPVFNEKGEFSWNFSTEDRQESLYGTAAFLTSGATEDVCKNVLIEGAPGQGKSTISQFLCQIHRIRWLGIPEDQSRLPAFAKTSPIRVPIKIELRHYSAWISGIDPFVHEGKKARPENSDDAIESFISHSIQRGSGGQQFNVADLTELLKSAPALLVLDGLDEVADLKRREKVIVEIQRLVQRSRSTAQSLQIIVTSRPPAFENAPNLPEQDFARLFLKPLNRKQIESYSEKWMVGSQLVEDEKPLFRSILSTKIVQPHLRELARNPMQLTILLSLIHTHGESLPDRRTALYDQYVDLFFSRESSKHSVVRDNREILIGIHKFLAWHLHSQAESKGASGSISVTDIRSVLSRHLLEEGHQTEIVEDLFNAMVERVVMIVSREQGAFEFEVQPLREYFAAKYLYDTSPQTPAYEDKVRGTKVERFDALSRNSYWLNVTRFFAGCYTRGELPSLVYSLRELLKEAPYSYLSQPRRLIVSLLSDWVFLPHPASMHDLLKNMSSSKEMRKLIRMTDSRAIHNPHSSKLPKQCGGTELAEQALDLIQGDIKQDELSAYCRFIGSHLDTEDIAQNWVRVFESLDEELQIKKWIEIGEKLPILNSESCTEVVKSSERRDLLLSGILYGVSLDSLTNAQISLAIEFLFSMEPHYHYPITNESNEFHIISTIIEASTDSPAYFVGSRRKTTFWDKMNYRRSALADITELDDLARGQNAKPTNSSEVLILRNFLKKIAHILLADVAPKSLKPWDSLIKEFEIEWGERPAFWKMAIKSAGIVSKSEKGEEADLIDTSTSLCQRVRYARMRNTNGKWWTKQLLWKTDIRSTTRGGIIATALSWISPKTFLKLRHTIENSVQALDEATWLWVIGVVKEVAISNAPDNWYFSEIAIQNMSEKPSERLLTILAIRSKPQARFDLLHKFCWDYKGENKKLHGELQETAMWGGIQKKIKWNEALKTIREGYKFNCVSIPYYYNQYSRFRRGFELPSDISESILAESELYPLTLVEMAEASLMSNYASSADDLITAAQRDEWFGDTHRPSERLLV